MPQPVDPIKLKASAEHLEWVLNQYPESDDVQALYRALLPLIEKAKAGDVVEPAESIPGGYNFADGRYLQYQEPSVDAAYASFSVEMRGGLTEQDKRRIARMDAMRKAMAGDSSHER